MFSNCPTFYTNPFVQFNITTCSVLFLQQGDRENPLVASRAPKLADNSETTVGQHLLGITRHTTPYINIHINQTDEWKKWQLVWSRFFCPKTGRDHVRSIRIWFQAWVCVSFDPNTFLRTILKSSPQRCARALPNEILKQRGDVPPKRGMGFPQREGWHFPKEETEVSPKSSPKRKPKLPQRETPCSPKEK